MAMTLNSDTIILIDNFINKHFTDKQNKQEIKNEAIEIAESIAKQSSKDKEDLKSRLATKADLKDLEITMQTELKSIEITFIKWLTTSQLTLVAVLVAIFAIFAK